MLKADVEIVDRRCRDPGQAPQGVVRLARPQLVIANDRSLVGQLAENSKAATRTAGATVQQEQRRSRSIGAIDVVPDPMAVDREISLSSRWQPGTSRARHQRQPGRWQEVPRQGHAAFTRTSGGAVAPRPGADARASTASICRRGQTEMIPTALTYEIYPEGITEHSRWCAALQRPPANGCNPFGIKTPLSFLCNYNPQRNHS